MALPSLEEVDMFAEEEEEAPRSPEVPGRGSKRLQYLWNKLHG